VQEATAHFFPEVVKSQSAYDEAEVDGCVHHEDEDDDDRKAQPVNSPHCD